MPDTRRALLALAIAPFLIAGCGDDEPGGPRTPVVDITSSFEAGLDGWSVAATDTLVGGAGIPWHVRHSTAMAREGSGAVELFMANYTDAAKIWLARPVTVEPNRAYRVSFTYALATADYGDVGIFALLTGATPTEPRTALELDPTFMRNATGNGASSDVGYVWKDVRREVDVTSGADGKLWLVVGVWGTFEVTRTYHVDALRVRVTER